MGLIKRTVTTEVIDLHNYNPEFNDDGTEKHIVCDGARFHVISYNSNGRVCSAPNCEVNKPTGDEK